MSLYQINIFGEVEILQEDGTVRRCQHCKKVNNREQTDFCSDKCIQESLDEVFGTLEKQKTDEK